MICDDDLEDWLATCGYREIEQNSNSLTVDSTIPAISSSLDYIYDYDENGNEIDWEFEQECRDGWYSAMEMLD